MKYLLTLVLGLAFIGCATSGKINAVQIGMTKDEVVAVMGNPVSVSAKGESKYLNYRLSETSDNAYYGITTPYYVRLINGKVDSFGRTGDFDSTQKTTVRIETDENVNIKGKSDLYTELKKLKELRDESVITEEEFQQQKKRILEKY